MSPNVYLVLVQQSIIAFNWIQIYKSQKCPNYLEPAILAKLNTEYGSDHITIVSDC